MTLIHFCHFPEYSENLEKVKKRDSNAHSQKSIKKNKEHVKSQRSIKYNKEHKN